MTPKYNCLYFCGYLQLKLDSELNSDVGIFPDPDDCSWFYFCSYGTEGFDVQVSIISHDKLGRLNE